jgi:hypothetical protein
MLDGFGAVWARSADLRRRGHDESVAHERATGRPAGQANVHVS